MVVLTTDAGYHCAGDGLVCFHFFVFVVASVFA